MATPPKPDDKTLPHEPTAGPKTEKTDREALIAALEAVTGPRKEKKEATDPGVNSLAANPAPSGKRPAHREAPKSDPKLVALGSDPNAPSYNVRDTYAGKRTDVKPLEAGKAAAAEVSQGAWRERAFQPRGVMSADEILTGLGVALDEAKKKSAPKTIVLQWLRDEWLQFLRQAVEQAGGDALDVWLSAALKPGDGKAGINLVLVELYVAFQKMRAALTTDAMLGHAGEVVAAVKGTLDAPSRRPVSFKVLERELEGKIDVDGLLLFLLSSEDELTTRAKEIGTTLERIRDEVKKMPGAKPDGMYSNFARLKAEAKLIDGELKRRSRAAR